MLRTLQPDAWYGVQPLTLAVARAGQAPPAARGTTARRSPPPALRRRPADGAAIEPALAPLQTELVWLGVLEAGREAPGRTPAVRLTPVGAWLLGLGPPPIEPAADLVAEPSLRLLVYEVDAPLLWSLLAFAAPEHLDRVSLFRLSRAGVLDGLAAGLSGAAMVAALGRAARHELPQNVVYAVRDWARAGRQARLSRALILTFDDEPARDRALAVPQIRTLNPEPLPGARLALPAADDEAEAAARQALAALGFIADGQQD